MPFQGRLLVILCVIGPALSCFDSSAVKPPIGAQLLLKNGAIYTVDPEHAWADAVAIADGKMIYVGSTAGAADFVTQGTVVIDLKGKMVLPGFVDSHAHVLEGGVSLSMCDLTAFDSKEAYLIEIKKYANEHPAKQWVAGFGWALENFPQGNPLKGDLDKVVPDRPVFMLAEDGHSAWVNSRALEILNITRDTPDPSDGRIERDANGNPSGTLRDGAATRAQAIAVNPNALEAAKGLLRGIDLFNANGVTSIIEARANTEQLYDLLYGAVNSAGGLHARVTLSLFLDPNADDSQVERMISKYTPQKDALLKVDQVKIFLDGVTESQTAALLEPYVGEGGTRGILNFKFERLKRWAIAFDRAGFQLHMHAIGDSAVRQGLDLVEAVQTANGRHDARPHLAHLYLVSEEDRPRFKLLGAIANFQAAWAYPADFNENLNRPLLGDARYDELMPIRSLADAGAMLVGGSDWPAGEISPLFAMQVALTRQDPSLPKNSPVLNPAQRVELAALLDAYTINGAYLQHREAYTGSVEVGKEADLEVLERNLFRISPYEIANTKVLLTLLSGKPVFGAFHDLQ